MTAAGIRLFQTQEHPCGYWPERAARDLLLDPREPSLPTLYGGLLALGFRRSGGNVYRPRCAHCRDCTPLRVPIATFQPSRAQRRCVRGNADLAWQDCDPGFSDERFALYRRYLAARHPGGGMDQASRFDFEQFLSCRWSPTRFFEARLDGELRAVAVTDVVDDALSAVYTFFDPELSSRSLGAAAILQQIEWARQTGRQFLYLGFWLPGHAKMDYKAAYRPAEVMIDGHWQPFGSPCAG